jgi:ankyrin repeat protein
MSTRMTAQRLARLVAAGDAEAVRTATGADPRLLSRGVERDGQGGWTPLHLAVAERQTEVVEVLVEVGANLEATTEHGRTPLHLALEVSPDQVADLRRLGARLDAAAAAYLDDVEGLTAELDRGAMLTDPLTGVDLLSWAARGGAA